MTAPTAPPVQRRSRVGGVARWVGVVCLVLASGVGGYLTWVLWGTGIETAHAQARLRTQLEPRLDTESPGSPDAARPVLRGNAVAQLLIPKIEADYIVVEGTDTASLTEGPGHYVQTAMPWDAGGRVGIAGHRTTYLHPFQNLDQLRSGDSIVLRTRYGTFQYRVTRVFAIPAIGSGRVLRQTVAPTLVLTTCHPEYSSAERLIVYANRVDQGA